MPHDNSAPSLIAVFHNARQGMNAAWSAWVATKPDAQDVAEELEGTISTLRQLRELATTDA